MLMPIIDLHKQAANPPFPSCRMACMSARLQRKQAAAERDAEECGQASCHAHERSIAQALPAQPKHAAGHAADCRAAQRQQRRLRSQAPACAEGLAG